MPSSWRPAPTGSRMKPTESDGVPPQGSDGPEDEDESGPVRRCIATGERLEKHRLIRFVVGPDGSVVPDLEAKLPGRGLYVRADRAALEMAVTRKAFAKAARRQVTVAADLPQVVERLILGRCVGLLGLARRAGQAVLGFDQVEQALRAGSGAGSDAGSGALLVQAVDAAPGGRAKLAGKVSPDRCHTVLTGAELGGAFGRDHLVHVAVAPGKLAERLAEELARLAGLRPDTSGSSS